MFNPKIQEYGQGKLYVKKFQNNIIINEGFQSINYQASTWKDENVQEEIVSKGVFIVGCGIRNDAVRKVPSLHDIQHADMVPSHSTSNFRDPQVKVLCI